MKAGKPWLSLFLCLALPLSGCGFGPHGTEDSEETRGSSRRVASSAEEPAPSETPALEETPPPTEACGILNGQEDSASSPEPLPETSTPAPAAVSVRCAYGETTEIEHVEFTGVSADGRDLWTRVFTSDYRTELTLIEPIGIWKDRYYLNRCGTLVCLSLADGSTLWENDGFGGASVSSVIDRKTGAVYLCGWYGPDFFAADADGNTLADFRTLEEGFYWPADMAYCGPNELVIYFHNCPGGAGPLPYYVDLTDFSITWYFGTEEMDEAAQYWANIFVSDFIEQYIASLDLETADDMELADFAHMFCKINRRSALSYDGDYETLSLGTVNELCERFFGRTLDPAEGVLRRNDWGVEWRFENGKYYYPAADGEMFNRFAVVTELLHLPDGKVQMGFDVYALDYEEYFNSGMDSALYHMSAAEAAALAAAGRITRLGSGTALAVPVEQSGHDGYWLLQLESSLG